MTKNIRRILGLTSVVFTLFVNTSFAESKKFTLQENKNLELCQELNKIFAEPENASMFEGYENILRRINPKEEPDPEDLKSRKYVFVTPEFVIPAKYKNFKLPKWEDSNAEEFLKSVSGLPENFVAAIKEGKVREFKKSKFDLAHNGGSEVVLRFSSEKGSRQNWGCRVSEITGNDLVAKDYNTRGHGFCFFFYYKGRIYNSDYAWDYIMISEPKMLFNGGFITPTVCTFDSK
jgi:hypothetical protein